MMLSGISSTCAEELDDDVVIDEGAIREGYNVEEMGSTIEERSVRGAACDTRSRGAGGYVEIDRMYGRVFNREPMEDYQKRALQT